jgi:spore coat polysaccharide biosynthesis predicted glycosyltransferase SpsG/RimJ/RimL family protein N-acetyltransferase
MRERVPSETHRRPLVVMRADGGSGLGLGHVMRLRAVASAVRRRGGRVIALGAGFEAVAEAEGLWDVRSMFCAGSVGWDTRTDAVEAQRLIGLSEPTAILTDHYGLDPMWEEVIRSAFPNVRIVAFDDLVGRLHAADVVVDANLGDGGPGLLPGRSGRILRGTHYAPLDDGYRLPRAEQIPPEGPERILLTLGASATNGIVERLVSEIVAEPLLKGVSVTVVVPDDAERTGVELAAGERAGISIRSRVSSLRPLIEAADLVIGAGGTSAWQRLRLGTPSVVVALADNQIRTCRALADLGLARWVEDTREPRAIVQAVVESFGDPELGRRTSRLGPLLVDGLGADRIAFHLLPPKAPPTIRLAQARDAAALLGIANDPVTRSESRNGCRIGPEEHSDWFDGVLRRSGTTFWVAESDGLVIGHVRFEELGTAFELSYGLDPIARGLGWSRTLVEQGLRRLRSIRDLPVVAVAHEANHVSRRVLEGAGFASDPGGARATALGARVSPGFAAYLHGV